MRVLEVKPYYSSVLYIFWFLAPSWNLQIDSEIMLSAITATEEGRAEQEQNRTQKQREDEDTTEHKQNGEKQELADDRFSLQNAQVVDYQ